jgi:hypothetical protein
LGNSWGWLQWWHWDFGGIGEGWSLVAEVLVQGDGSHAGFVARVKIMVDLRLAAITGVYRKSRGGFDTAFRNVGLFEMGVAQS